MKRTPPQLALDDQISQQIGEHFAPAELSAEQRSRMRERMLQRARDTAPTGTRTIRHAQGEWRRLSAQIEVKVLSVNEAAGTQSLMMRVKPGGMIPPHQHTHEEELFVLEGECHIGTQHQLFAGDMHIAAAGSAHNAITTREGVTLLLRTDYPAPEYRA